MSSATSIDRDVPVEAGARREPPAAARTAGSPRDAFRPWHFFVLTSLLAATAAVVLTRESRPEQLIVISLTIGAAGFAAAALHRTLAPLLTNERAPLQDPLTPTARAGLEREKVLVLRAIKELEFDRAMRKVSERDFDEMAGRLRARAMWLIRQLESDAGYRPVIERELSARLSRAAGGNRAAEALRDLESGRQAGAEGQAAREARSEGVRPATGVLRCPCGTVNDADAAFCKRCGSRLASSSVS